MLWFIFLREGRMPRRRGPMRPLRALVVAAYLLLLPVGVGYSCAGEAPKAEPAPPAEPTPAAAPQSPATPAQPALPAQPAGPLQPATPAQLPISENQCPVLPEIPVLPAQPAPPGNFFEQKLEKIEKEMDRAHERLQRN